MSAKEMFEKLGYEKAYDSDMSIWYERNDIGTNSTVLFHIKEKEIETFRQLITGTCMPFKMDNEVLKAIIAQAKELRWLSND